VDIEPANTIELEPFSGDLNPDGSASLYFKRVSPSPATGRINCKVTLRTIYEFDSKLTPCLSSEKFTKPTMPTSRLLVPAPALVWNLLVTPMFQNKRILSFQQSSMTRNIIVATRIN
jgi:hypothetical protein